MARLLLTQLGQTERDGLILFARSAAELDLELFALQTLLGANIRLPLAAAAAALVGQDQQGRCSAAARAGTPDFDFSNAKPHAVVLFEFGETRSIKANGLGGFLRCDSSRGLGSHICR